MVARTSGESPRFVPEIVISSDPDTLMRAATSRIATFADAAIAARGRFDWALSGGSTPRGLYALLASNLARGIDWPHVEFFWGDERCVPPTHDQSNFRMAREVLLDAIDVDPRRVHRMRGEEEPETAARAYEALLREHFGVQSQQPRFDVVLLGMGSDGHTASLFPGTPALDETEHWVVANRNAPGGTPRLTLTFPIINAAAHVMFLITGADKAERVREVLEELDTANPLPAARVRPTNGRLLFMLDAAAASRLTTPRDTT